MGQFPTGVSVKFNPALTVKKFLTNYKLILQMGL